MELIKEGNSAEAIDAVGAMFKLIARLRDENNRRALQIARMVRENYGRKSESVDAHQLSLFLKSVTEDDQAQEDEASAENEARIDALRLELKELRELKKKGKGRRPGGRNPLPEDLPRETITLSVSDEERTCEQCEGEKKTIGFAKSQVLEFIPASFKVIVYEREKVACKVCESGLATAPTADKVIESGLPGPGLLAHVVVSKYLEHMPIHRLAQRYRQLGVPLPASTLGQWTGVVADNLIPLYSALKDDLLAAHVLGADDTGIKVLDKKASANVRRGAMWAYVAYEQGKPALALFEYAPNRKGIHPRAFLNGRKGYIQGDGYQGLDRMFAGPAPPECVKVGCMMHVRRYFKKALDAGDLRAAVPVDLIARLYSVEALATEKDLPCEERQALRASHSKPLMDRLHRWATKLYPQAEPSSPLGRALTHCLGQWDSVTVYLADGAIPIDNGEVERRIRPVALGRKNWLFAGSDKAAQRSAVIFSLMACCLLADIEPLNWLTDILTRLCQGWPNSRLHELLPHQWAKAQTKSSPSEAA